jgi:hypothetical protein
LSRIAPAEAMVIDIGIKNRVVFIRMVTEIASALPAFFAVVNYVFAHNRT